MDNSFKIAHYNIRSLLPKINAFREHIAACDYSVVCISESWLHGDIPDTYIDIHDYIVIRRDRPSRGGGVCIYIKHSINFSVINSSNRIEQLWLRLTINRRHFAVGVVYRSENVSYGEFLGEFEDSVSEILPTSEELFCLGDLNIDLMDVDCASTKRLNEFLDCFNIKQVVDSPTRVTLHTASLIDLIMVSNESLVTDVGVFSPGLSDHELVSCSLAIRPPVTAPVYKLIRDFRYFNEELFVSDLIITPLHRVFSLGDVNDKLNFLCTKLLSLFGIHAPLRNVKITRRPAPWLTDNLRLLISLRDEAHARWRRTKSVAHYNYYKSLRNFVTLANRAEKKAYINYCVRNEGPNAIWKRLGIKNNHREIPLVLQNADALNDYYVNSISAVPTDNSVVDLYLGSVLVTGEGFCFDFVSQEDVCEIICRLKSKAVGCDGISVNLIKMCCPYILPFVTHVINSCLEQSVFPDTWKQAVVTPVPKVSNPTHYGDLRPISVLPVLSKVLEKVMEVQLRSHLELNNILPEKQSGFRPLHGCGTALLDVMDDILRATDDGLVTVLLLFDFSKAFDMLNHEILLALLQHIGLSDTSVSLFVSYFSDRTQRVRVREHLSFPLGLSSGVPQGSILGPLLYTIYTMYLPTVLKTCKLHLYADDTQIYHSFKSENISEAAHLINNDIEGLLNFAESHSLKINNSKTKALLFGPAGQRLLVEPLLKLKVGDSYVEFESAGKSLGVTFNSDLRFRLHINNCIRAAYSNLRLIYINRYFLSRKSKIMLCESLVLSKFSFCDFVYGPCILARDRQRIQVLQNSCMRLIFGIRRRQHISHKLEELGWLNMSCRRFLHAACLFHKVIIFKAPIYLYRKIQFRTDVHSLNLRFRGRLTPPQHRTEKFKSSFTYQIANIYNSVPDNFKLLNAVKFKYSMKLWLLTS